MINEPGTKNVSGFFKGSWQEMPEGRWKLVDREGRCQGRPVGWSTGLTSTCRCFARLSRLIRKQRRRYIQGVWIYLEEVDMGEADLFEIINLFKIIDRFMRREASLRREE
ncbi:hypothetical protein BK140_26675 [Paenibacillus macerans]|nr:hypothetical protein BK140_26675 [Paenibacillus macerans]